jgi:hypothetical protein
MTRSILLFTTLLAVSSFAATTDKAVIETRAELYNNSAIKMTQVIILPLASLRERNDRRMVYDWGEISTEFTESGIAKDTYVIDQKFFIVSGVINKMAFRLNRNALSDKSRKIHIGKQMFFVSAIRITCKRFKNNKEIR